MGKHSLIGFHAAHRADDGSKFGMANALVGKYLADLGLSYAAIGYITKAPPKSMTWLTEAEAAGVGIEISVIDEQMKVPEKRISKSVDLAQLRRRTADFLNKYYLAVSALNNEGWPLLKTMYSDTVTYFGKDLQRDRVLEQLTGFLNRWPQRKYKPRETATQIDCDGSTLACTAKGILDFDARSPERNERSWGVASFEFRIRFEGDGMAPQIMYEGGEPLSRQKGPLRAQSSVHQRD